MADIRRAKPEDEARLRELVRAVCQESPRFRDKGFSDDKLTAFYRAQVNGPNSGWFVAEADGQIVGFAMGMLAEYFFSTEFYAYDLGIYVVPELRGTSVAVKLIKTLENWALVERGARELYLGVSTGIEMERTVYVYGKLGFNLVSQSLTKEKP